jgi:hypothetical protein
MGRDGFPAPEREPDGIYGRRQPSSRSPRPRDREALLWNWRTAAREAGLQFPKWEKERLASSGRLDPARELQLQARVSVNGARDHLGERRAVFGLSELEREALSHGRNRSVKIDDVRKEISSRDDLVVANRGDAVVARLTTSQAIEEERGLLMAVERGRGRGPNFPSPEQARGLAKDHLCVARHVLGSPDRLVVVEGSRGGARRRRSPI